MKRVSQTKQFHRDVKRMRKRGKELSKLQDLVCQLAEGKPLSPQYRDHPLVGAWAPSRDCHVEPDWILIYTPGLETLLLERTGTHADVFRN
jgi:mRNA interferase YafQ